MGKCKAKAIHTDLGTFRHNQTYPGIIQAYSKPCVILAYLEPWYIQNSDILRTGSIFGTLAYSEPEAYSEHWHIQNSGIFRAPVYSEGWHFQNPRHIQNPVKPLQ